MDAVPNQVPKTQAFFHTVEDVHTYAKFGASDTRVLIGAAVGIAITTLVAVKGGKDMLFVTNKKPV